MAQHPRSFARVWTEYLTARTAAAVLTAVPLEANLAIARQIARALWRVDRKHARRTRDNLRLAFPEFDDDAVERIGVASFEHFTQLAAEAIHTHKAVSPASWPGRFYPVDLGPAAARLASDRPTILVTGHLGNWELLGNVLAAFGFDSDAIARPLDNPRLNAWIMGMRERKGLRIITKWDATDRMLAVLDAGGALGFIADQNAGDKGLFVPFLGKLASTYKSVGLLAIQQQASIVCGYAHRLPPTADDPRRFRYAIGVTDVIDPQDWADRRDPLFYLTARYSRALETMIRREPAQYLWMHRRWKSRPRHERLGKPMPKTLRRNLEELPWMTDELMRSCEAGVG